MTKILLTAVASVAVAFPQAAVGIRPASPNPDSSTASHLEAARPLLGYLTQGSDTDGPQALYAVVGSPAHPAWGEPLSLPGSASLAFLPPLQEYALLSSNAGLSAARLSRSAVYSGTLIPNVMARPEQVVFGPSGNAAALFSSAASRIEVVAHLPANAQLSWSVSVNEPRDLLRFAVSDDGELVVALFSNQPPLFSLHGAAWQQLATNYWPDAWTFLPGSHNLVFSDHTRKAVVVLQDVGLAPVVERVLETGGINANLLAPNKQGTELLAAAAGQSAAWSIDLLTGAVTPLHARDKIDSLTLLRDGLTFLVSSKESPVLVKLAGSAAQSALTTFPNR